MEKTNVVLAPIGCYELLEKTGSESLVWLLNLSSRNEVKFIDVSWSLCKLSRGKYE